MKPKDKKAFIIYAVLTVIMWQFAVSLTKIFVNPRFMAEDNPLFSIKETINSGAAFGMFENNSHILGILGIIVLLVIAFFVYKNLVFQDKIKILTISMFSAGIIGNSYERLTTGHVFDFIKLNIFEFPVFNLFDILITTSVFLYIIFCIREEFKKRIKA